MPRSRRASIASRRRSRPELELLDRAVEVAALGQQDAEVVVAVHVAGRDAGAVGLLGGLLVAHLVGVVVAQRQPGGGLAALGAALEHGAGLGLAAGGDQQVGEVLAGRRVQVRAARRSSSRLSRGTRTTAAAHAPARGAPEGRAPRPRRRRARRRPGCAAAARAACRRRGPRRRRPRGRPRAPRRRRPPLEHQAEVAPRVGLAAGERHLVGRGGVLPPLLRGQRVAQVERTGLVAQAGRAAEALLRVAVPAGVRQVAAERDERVDVPEVRRRRRRPSRSSVMPPIFGRAAGPACPGGGSPQRVAGRPDRVRPRVLSPRTPPARPASASARSTRGTAAGARRRSAPARRR